MMQKLLLFLTVPVVTVMLACTDELPKKAETPSDDKASAYGEKAPAYGEAAPSFEEKTSAEAESAPSYGRPGADSEKGRMLFRDVSFGNGTAGKSCNSCHPEGRGLESAGSKTGFLIMGQEQGSLEDAVNFCIEMALKGTAIDRESQEMKDVTAYIKSLGT